MVILSVLPKKMTSQEKINFKVITKKMEPQIPVNRETVLGSSHWILCCLRYYVLISCKYLLLATGETGCWA